MPNFKYLRSPVSSHGVAYMLEVKHGLKNLLNWGFACPPSKLMGQNP